MRWADWLAALGCALLLCGCAATPLPEACATLPVAQDSAEEALKNAAANSTRLTTLPEELLLLLPEATQAPPQVQEGAAAVAVEADDALARAVAAHMEAAMEALLQSARFDSGSVEISYCLTYRSDTLFSALLEAEDAAGNLAVQPVTFEIETGRSCCISDFFSGEETGWRGLLADIVSDAAAARGIALLNEVPPVRDDQLFYVIADGSIVLLYRPYEITTYQAGFPCFVLPMRELEGYLSGAYGLDGRAEETAQQEAPSGMAGEQAAVEAAVEEDTEEIQP